MNPCKRQKYSDYVARDIEDIPDRYDYYYCKECNRYAYPESLKRCSKEDTQASDINSGYFSIPNLDFNDINLTIEGKRFFRQREHDDRK